MRNLSAFQPNGLKQIQLADTALFSDANLDAYYKLEDANDSKNTNHLTNTAVTFSTAKFNNGGVFNGSTAILRLANSFQYTGNFSLSGWVKPTDATAAATQTIIQNELTGAAGGPYSVTIQTSGKLRFSVYATGTGIETYVESVAALSDATIVFFTCVRDGSNIIMYLNGAYNNQTAWSTAQITNASNYFQLGATQNGGGTNFRQLTGWLDDVAVFSKALTAGEVSQLYYAGSTKAYYPLNGNPAGSLKDGAVAYWKMDESSGNITDSVGSYTGTNSGGVTFSAGKINNGANFSTDSFAFAGNPITGTNAYFTVSFWLKSVETANTSFIRFSSASDADETNIQIDANGHLAAYGHFGNGGTGGGTVNDGNWHHGVVIYDGQFKIYVDNTLVTTGVAFTHVAYNDMELGTGYYGGFDGSLDEVGIWNRALTPDEISRLYNAGNGMQLETRALDYSGNANHGTETAITYPQGRFGQGAKFNGSSSYITNETGLGLTYSSIRTVSLWANIATQPSASNYCLYRLLFGTNPSNYTGILYIDDAGTKKIRLATSPANFDLNYQLISGNWYNFVITHDGTGTTGAIKVYMNGRLIITGDSWTSDYSALTTRSVIGANHTFAEKTNGLIDEVIIESRAWTAKEVETYYRKSVLNYKRKTLWQIVSSAVSNSGFFNFFR